jgi:aminoglycoside phosphotransferase (APT) family kinase protein
MALDPARLSPRGAEAALDLGQPGALAAYLVQRGAVAADEPLEITPLTGGVSNKTLLVRRPSGEAWVVKQALAKLAVKVDWFADPARVHREAAGLRELAQALPPGATPVFLFEDSAQHVLAMTAVPEPHANWKELLLAGRVEPAHVAAFGDLLGRMHAYGRRHLEALRPTFADRAFFEALRLEPYYLYTAGEVPAAAAFLRALVDETRAIDETLVHGDYSPKNVLVQGAPGQTRLVLLDHEVVHLGDGAFDVGFALTHLLSKAHHLVPHRAAFADAAQAFWRDYTGAAWPAAAAGPPPGFEARVVRHTLACLLARAAGRSPLEYLDAAARARQIGSVLSLVATLGALPPDAAATVRDLSSRFVALVSTPRA